MRAAVLALGSLLLACSSNEGDDGGGGGSAGKAGGGAASGGAAGSTAGSGASGANGGASGAGAAAGSGGGSAGSTGGAGGSSAGSGGSSGSGGGGGSSAAWTCPAGPFDTDPVPEAAAPTPIAGAPPADNYHEGMFQILEGPVWFEGALYVSQITQVGSPPKSRVLKVLDGAVTVALNDIGTNGLALDENGALLGARHLDGSISRLDPANPANVTPVVAMYDGARFNSPNDIAVRSDGHLYFTDPDYQAPSPPPQGNDTTRVYHLAPGASEPTVVDESLTDPNGIMLSLDETTLFVTHPSGLVQYTVNPDGSTGAGTPVAGAPGGDGMGMDCAGNLYMTGTNQIIVLGPALTEIDSIDVPADGTTNVAFGGPERKTLFITHLGSEAGLYSVELNVPGKPY